MNAPIQDSRLTAPIRCRAGRSGGCAKPARFEGFHWGSANVPMCNFHAGVARRSRYQNDPVELTEERITELMADRAERIRQQDLKDAQQRAEREDRFEARKTREWATLHDAFTTTLVIESHERWNGEMRHEVSLKVHRVDVDPSAWHDTRIVALKQGEDGLPGYVAITGSGAEMTAEEALEFAQAIATASTWIAALNA